jgi:hypothetical protein
MLEGLFRVKFVIFQSTGQATEVKTPHQGILKGVVRDGNKRAKVEFAIPLI